QQKIKSRRKGLNATEAGAAPLYPGEEETEKQEEAPLIEGDYSKAKAPPNQIPVSQFWGYLESQYFRPLTDEDFAFLDSTADDIAPFIMPPLGKPYIEQWDDEEGALFDNGPDTAIFATAAITPNGVKSDLHHRYASHLVCEVDGAVVPGFAATPLGVLTERVLACLVEDSSATATAAVAAARRRATRPPATLSRRRNGVVHDVDDEEDGEDAENYGDADEDYLVPSISGTPASGRADVDADAFEDRIRAELRYLGLVADDGSAAEPNENGATNRGSVNRGAGNDEISRELRSLQTQLRTQADENLQRKRRLRELAGYYRGYEQYCGVLDALSKQIEADYTRRMRQSPKQKRRSRAVAAAAAAATALGPGVPAAGAAGGGTDAGDGGSAEPTAGAESTDATAVPTSLVPGAAAASVATTSTTGDSTSVAAATPRPPVQARTLDAIERRRLLVERVGCLFPRARVAVPPAGSVFAEAVGGGDAEA
ncbi:Transcriptional regulator, partial [Cladochytrium tenue]